MRRFLSAIAFVVAVAAFSPFAYYHVISPSMILPDMQQTSAFCDELGAKLQAAVDASANASSLLSVLSRRLLPVRPSGVRLEFYLVSANPRAEVVSWDFKRDVFPALAPTLRLLGAVVNVSVSSRLILGAKLGAKPALVNVSSGGSGESVYALSQASLKRFLPANDWSVGFAEDKHGRAVLRFAVVVPDATKLDGKPLMVRGKEHGVKPGFVVSRWGGVSFLNLQRAAGADGPGTVSRQLSVDEAAVAAGYLQHHLRQMFGLVSTSASGGEELLALANVWAVDHTQVSAIAACGGWGQVCPGWPDVGRAVSGRLPCRCLLQASCRAVLQTIEQSQRVSYMQVSPVVSDAVVTALDLLHAASAHLDTTSSSAEGSTAVIDTIRRARVFAETAAFDTTMPQMYLPPEHIAALLLPFWVPVVMPLLIAFFTGLRRWLRKRGRQPPPAR